MLQARGLTKEYAGRPALRGVDITLAPGRIVGLVGESGGGKSTLARRLCRLEGGGGEVAVADSADGKGPRVQLLFQDSTGALDPRARVASILREPLDHLGGLSRAAKKAEMLALLASVGLGADTLAKRPHELSGGQRQRVAIARALAARPDYLICDEPVSSLDADTAAAITGLLRRLVRERGIGCLFISHDLEVTAALCDTVCVMFAGSVVETLPAGEVAAARHPYTRSLFSYVVEMEKCCCTTAPPICFEVAKTGCAYRLQCPHAGPACEAVPLLAGDEACQIACHYPVTPGHRHAATA